MSLLFRVIYAAQASSTHHKLALDALTYLTHPSSAVWRDLFLKYHAVYLRGAKDPDVIFKDFRNHVLHVSENHWGGAALTARGWYERTVELLAREDWEQAIYAAGVLSHYFTDPIMPFHTGQSARESQIHRAAEWSVTKTYDRLMRFATEQGEIPKLKVPTTQDWLEEFVRHGATLAHEYYQPLIDHYDFERGSSHPEEGWDDYSQKVLSQLLMYAAVAFSMVLDRAFYESKATPIESDLTLNTFLATLAMPVHWITKKMEHLAEQAQVEAIYRELKFTGQLVFNLPEEQRVVKIWSDQAKAARTAINSTRKPGSARPIASQSEATTLNAARKPVVAHEIQSPPKWFRDVIPPLAAAALADDNVNHSVSSSVLHPRPAELVKPTVATGSPKQTTLASSPAANHPKTTTTTRDRQRQEETDLLEAARLSVEGQSTESTRPPFVTTASTSTSPDRYEHLLAPSAKTSPGKTKTSQTSPASTTSPQTSYYLDLTSDLVDAPSIGPKTAARFQRIHVKTVADFLKLDPKTTAHRLNTSHIKPDTIREWQDQARLVCQIPGLRGYHAQILTGCGYRTPAEVARANLDEMTVQAWDFSQTSIGQSILRNTPLPDPAKMQSWITAARDARSLVAA